MSSSEDPQQPVAAESAGTAPRRRRVSPGRRRPGEQVYRLTDRTIKVWTRVVSLSMPILVVIGGVVALISGLIADANDVESNPGLIVGVVIVASGVVFPLLIAAALGGESLHRGGSVVGILLAAGLLGTGVSTVVDFPWVMPWSIAAMIGGGIGFFVLGFIRRVPMWIGIGPSGPHTDEISDGILPGESAPGVLGSIHHKRAPTYHKRK